MTDETFDPDTDPAAEAPQDEAAGTPTTSEEAIGDAPSPTVGAPPASLAQEEAAEAEVKPREVIKGIHPELVCQDIECAPEFTELQFFSPEEATKTKGKTMLFCARSGKKYFSPAAELQAWIAENKIVKAGRGRKDG